MRKILVLAVATILLISCLSPEKKAQKLIKERLKETLHDYGSYESVNFSKLDSSFTDEFSDSLYAEYFKSIVFYGRELNEYKSQIVRYAGKSYYESESWIAVKMATHCNDSLNHYINLCADIKRDFIPKFDGWIMTHKFRANNGNGAKRLGENRYYFDIDLTKITDSKNIED